MRLKVFVFSMYIVIWGFMAYSVFTYTPKPNYFNLSLQALGGLVIAIVLGSITYALLRMLRQY